MTGSRRILRVGDLNADGFDDVLHENPEGIRVIFGSSIGISLEQSQSTELTVARNEDYSNSFPTSVAVSDLNGDGVDDVVLTDRIDPRDSTELTQGRGIAYVLFGSHQGYPSEINLREYVAGGDTGFSIKGFAREDSFGESMGVGDFNGDGVSDVIIGGTNVSSPSGFLSGATHVLYGRRNLAEVGPMDVSVRVVPGETLVFAVTDSGANEDSEVRFVAELPDGVDDLSPANNIATLELDSIPTPSADANVDGSTNFQDFRILASNFGKEDAVFADGDFDGDGRVSFLDFLVLAQNFGKTL